MFDFFSLLFFMRRTGILAEWLFYCRFGSPCGHGNNVDPKLREMVILYNPLPTGLFSFHDSVHNFLLAPAVSWMKESAANFSIVTKHLHVHLPHRRSEIKIFYLKEHLRYVQLRLSQGYQGTKSIHPFTKPF